MKTQEIQNPETPYSGNLIDSLLDTVVKVTIAAKHVTLESIDLSLAREIKKLRGGR